MSHMARGLMIFYPKSDVAVFAYLPWSGTQHRQRTQRTRNLLVPLIRV